MLERLDAVRAIFNNLDVIVWAVDSGGTIVVSEGAGSSRWVCRPAPSSARTSTRSTGRAATG
ncbi:hypothetical protein [Nannocystis pusilla]|uniref:hypothetical protein n=1 Tax=Nannocystis pusilla TaxID=889268 RepID=UPI003B818914